MKIREEENTTFVTEFILLGLPDLPKTGGLLFMTFFLIYITTLAGNLLLIIITQVEPHLYSPMYYFLSQLSLLDMCYSSVTVPNMLVNLLSEKKTISFNGCLIQLQFFVHFACAESLILCSMAYDRYVAICRPLHYTRMMNTRVIGHLSFTSWSVSFLYATAHTVSTSTLMFCGSGVNHFFCDLPALFKLSCTYPSSNVLGVLLSGGMIGLFSLVVMLGSYTLITRAIMNIRSARGQQKAFSTCVSHLAAVSLFYGAFMFAYVQTLPGFSMHQETLAAVFYTAVTPMLNPFIYALRNKEIKEALRKQRSCRLYIVLTYMCQNGAVG